MTAAELLVLWESLAGEIPKPAGMDRRRVLPDAVLDLFACRFWPGAQAGLLIEAESTLRIGRDRLPDCRGLRFVHEQPRPGWSRQSLAIFLEAPGLEEVFAVLAADLLSAVAAADTPDAGLRRGLDRIAMWQGLLAQLPAAGLSEEAQRGLFGELVVLDALHLEALDAHVAVTSWDGPGRAYQDFESDGVAVEVKTSLAKRHARLQITSEKQLDETPLRALFLVHVALSAAATGASLNGKVKWLRERLTNDHAALNEFNLRLVGAGYLEAQADLYEGTRYLVERVRAFAVEGGFPRLTAAQLPPGVGDVTYSIIADDLGAFETPLPSVIARIGSPHG